MKLDEALAPTPVTVAAFERNGGYTGARSRPST
jgi:hypothetical protein